MAVEQREEWLTGRRYLDMEELREHRRSEKGEAEEVMPTGGQGKDDAWRRLQRIRGLTLLPPGQFLGIFQYEVFVDSVVVGGA